MKKLIASLSILVSFMASADVVVLLHGYDSNANVWFSTGVHQNLNKKYAGKHTIYSLPLPSTAPLMYQANTLSRHLDAINNKHDEPIILVGHSTGGVVARMLLTKKNTSNIKGLISVSSPHLGSKVAFISNMVSGMPFIGVLPGFETLEESKILYGNLRWKSPFLKNLNTMRHEDACYVSIVRDKSLISNMISSQYSQNMNSIPALRGRSYVLRSHSSHGIRPYDVVTISNAIDICE
ncbi:MAG TPA: alpha/beta hydrolase [Candidatus Thioglobus sp.]|jgi:pimeloyl-ACP methyl ester carboxylesterase|nr:alpha/beta hydrolase [Candidatus Thioglobus sp.]HIL41834.1 alpha/beta hydrolase [Gammaproteobacteria bacterium]